MSEEFVELKTDRELPEAFPILKELVPPLAKDEFLRAHDHELLKPHKLFGLRVSGELVSVAAAWVLMTGLFDKILWIHAFVTKEDMRARGYGKQLLSEIEHYGRKEGFTEIRAHAHRERALEFWQEKVGYEAFSTVLRKPL